jgi:uncharacterized membrane protein (UPF0127 family)
MRRIFLFALLTIAACSGGGIDGFVNNPGCESIAKRLTEEPFREARIGLVSGDVTTMVDVEVADEPGSQSRGLMCRTDVPYGTGMLFEFNGLASGPFWMFNTYVPLDIIYFNRSGGVAGTAVMLPCPNEGNESESAWRDRCLEDAAEYDPGTTYTDSVELPGGWLLSEGFAIDSLPEDLQLKKFVAASR